MDDFGPVSDGWVASGGITRLQKRRGALQLHVEEGRGSAAKAVDWDLSGGGTLVLEVAGRDLVNARIVVVAEADSVTGSFDVSADPATFRYVVVPLPPGRFSGVRVEVEPRPGLSRSVSRDGLFVVRAGRLELRTVAVYPAASVVLPPPASPEASVP